MHELVDILFLRNWWTYADGGTPWFSGPYHWFNLLEGLAWMICGVVVFARYVRHRNSPLEIWYAIAFISFGLSDFREAHVQSSWLIWLKLINLIGLLHLRHLVITRYYPTRKLM